MKVWSLAVSGVTRTWVVITCCPIVTAHSTHPLDWMLNPFAEKNCQLLINEFLQRSNTGDFLPSYTACPGTANLDVFRIWLSFTMRSCLITTAFSKMVTSSNEPTIVTPWLIIVHTHTHTHYIILLVVFENERLLPWKIGNYFSKFRNLWSQFFDFPWQYSLLEICLLWWFRSLVFLHTCAVGTSRFLLEELRGSFLFFVIRLKCSMSFSSSNWGILSNTTIISCRINSPVRSVFNVRTKTLSTRPMSYFISVFSSLEANWIFWRKLRPL